MISYVCMTSRWVKESSASHGPALSAARAVISSKGRNRVTKNSAKPSEFAETQLGLFKNGGLANPPSQGSHHKGLFFCVTQGKD